MKYITILLFSLLTCSLYSQSYTYIEADSRLNKTFVPTITLYGEMPIGLKWGYTNYIYVTENWGEFLPGLYYKPTSQTLIAGYVGIEITEPNLRYGANISYTGTKIRGSIFAEKGNGKDNYWYDIQLWYTAIESTNALYYIVPRTRYGYGTGLGISMEQSNLLGDIDVFTTFVPFYQFESKSWRPTLFVALEF